MKNPLNIVSFPKSGRTWLRVMLDDIGVKALYHHDGSDHLSRNRLTDLNPDKSKYAGADVLLLVRDPRDIVVSGYFQVLHRLNLPVGSMSDFLRDERHGIRKICHFNIQWFAAGPRMMRFAILSYEQMYKAPAAALVAVASFAGLDLPEGNAELVASNREFSRMQAAEANGEFAPRYGNILLPGNRNDKDSFKIRRGVVGGYIDYLSDADLSYCDQILAKTHYKAHCDQALSQWGFERLRPSHDVVHDRTKPNR
jgi:hypothetical protein